MGFLRRLLGFERARSLAPGRGWVVPVVGESHYQDAIQTIFRASGGSEDDDDVKLIAALVPEDDNACDPNAVRIDIESRTVGYLPREMAQQYWEAFGVTMGQCGAKIVGGFELYDGSSAYFGVKLNFARPPRMK